MRPQIIIALVENSGQVLIQERLRRGVRVHEFPCGRVDNGETPENAARRELREETGLEITSSVLSPILTLPGGETSAAHFVRFALPDGQQPRMTDSRREQIFLWKYWSDIPDQDWFNQLQPADQRYVHLRIEEEQQPPFYTSIAGAYETIFPVDEETADFLVAGLQPGARILDLACGIGGYSRSLARRGFQITGVDFDAGSIALAQTASHLNPSPVYFAADMVAVDRIFPPARFHRAHCIGNSLIHLPDEKTIQAALKAIRTVLQPDGQIILQIINYDRILDQKIQALPTIERDGLRFVRHYDHQGDHVRFRTELHGALPDRVIHNDIPLLALRQERLASMLTSAGFTEQNWTGCLDDSTPWTEKSYATVVRAK